MRFSERFGHKKVKDIFQIDRIDVDLLNSLWNLLDIHIWSQAVGVRGRHPTYDLRTPSNHSLGKLCIDIWNVFFKKPIDQLSNDWEIVKSELRSYFFGCPWFEVYDFIEFVLNNYDVYVDTFDSFDAVLEREMSAYRFVNGLLVRITEQEQLDEIDLALQNNVGPVQTHLRRALELLSDRRSPDYRNSIKESISAIESLVADTLSVEKGTLGQLLKKLEDNIGLHSALKTAFSSLYGYTSDEGGIRHAILENKEIKFEDAKFFLVICSAFVNYVNAKMDDS